jgi:hypothetical protein
VLGGVMSTSPPSTRTTPGYQACIAPVGHRNATPGRVHACNVMHAMFVCVRMCA